MVIHYCGSHDTKDHSLTDVMGSYPPYPLDVDMYMLLAYEEMYSNVGALPSMAHIFGYCFTPWHIFFLIMHSISLKKPNFYAWAPTCYTLRTWRNNGSLSQSSLFPLSSFPLASLPSLLALLINSLSSLDKHFMFHSVSLILSQAPLARGSRALPSVLLKVWDG